MGSEDSEPKQQQITASTIKPSFHSASGFEATQGMRSMKKYSKHKQRNGRTRSHASVQINKMEEQIWGEQFAKLLSQTLHRYITRFPKQYQHQSYNWGDARVMYPHWSKQKGRTCLNKYDCCKQLPWVLPTFCSTCIRHLLLKCWRLYPRHRVYLHRIYR